MRESRAYGRNGLKGYCYFSKRTIFVVLNAFLPEVEKRIVAMHEAAHVILHRDLIRVAPMKDNIIYDMTSKTEYQANLFTADFLISDDEVEELTADEDMDYFRMCKALHVSPDLMSFKLFSMIQRGYQYKLPQGLNSTFLKS
ncbi:MAG: ImmA/IrrE family metallo-endopeptidase [Clostridiales bacterium]|nr:ImmA/IrrE family metallo-endopeptidase [Clostridiales bacterium]